MKINRSIQTLTLITLALTVACGGDNRSPATAAIEAGPLAQFFTEQSIDADERPIHQLREGLEPGAAVAFEGKVMGRTQVFIPGRAAFIVGDPTTITTCDLIPCDDCETPWDACCDDPDTISAGIITVQLVDEEGKVLAHDIREVNGLTELSMVRIEGVVADATGGSSVIVNASRIQVLP